MSAGIHSVRITIEPGYRWPTVRALCSDPSADCHYVCAEGCETWGPIVRDEAGAVLGHAEEGASPTDPLHAMRHTTACTYATWIENDDEPEESMTGGPFEVVVPAEFTFHGDYVTWEVATPTNGASS